MAKKRLMKQFFKCCFLNAQADSHLTAVNMHPNKQSFGVKMNL